MHTGGYALYLDNKSNMATFSCQPLIRQKRYKKLTIDTVYYSYPGMELYSLCLIQTDQALDEGLSKMPRLSVSALSLRSVLLFLLVLNLISLCRTSAACADWTSIGPDGGMVSALAIDPVNHQNIYVSTEGGVFKSADGGAGWRKASSGLSYPAMGVPCLVVDPVNPNTIYAGTFDSGVYKSTDCGENWIAVNSGFYPMLEGLSVQVDGIVIDPSTPETIYAATSAGVFKSTDGGNAWVQANSGLASNYISSLAIDPATRTIYVGTETGGIFKTTDGGASWVQIGSALQSIPVYSLAIDPTAPRTIYAGTRSGIYKTTDGGASWNRIPSGLVTTYITSVVIDPLNPQVVYAVSAWYNLFKSTNGGESWEQLTSGLAEGTVGSMIIDPSDPSVLFAGTAGGVSKSVDGGANWNRTSSGLSSRTIALQLTIDPVDPNVIYGSDIFNGGIIVGINKSTDGGRTWTWIDSELPPSRNTLLAIDPVNHQAIYAGTRDGLFKSFDGGASWSRIDTNPPFPSVDSLAIDPTTPQTIYYTAYESDSDHRYLYKSTDGGEVWAKTDPGLRGAISLLVVSPADSRIVYAADQCGLSRSMDGGASWKKVYSSPGQNCEGNVWNGIALALDPVNPQTIYLGLNADDLNDEFSVFKSTDGGATWKKIYGLKGRLYSLMVDPLDSRNIYVGGDGAVFRSPDAGTSWSKFGTGLDCFRPTSMSFDSMKPRTLYATGIGGIYKTVEPPRLSPDLSSVLLLLSGQEQ